MSTCASISVRSEVAARPRIGVFDSGVGGLSILRALRERLPGAPMLYLGDTANAPYGERSAAEVAQYCERIVRHLADEGAELVVVACNTATVLAIDDLRVRWPQLRFVGVEPGVKPAAAQSRTRRIAVMTTPATAASERLSTLIRQHARDVHVHVQPCAGLAEAIECGALEGAELAAVLGPCCRSVLDADVDTVVLGCTHYPFVAEAIQDLLGPAITLIDTASAVAARVAALWPHSPDHSAAGVEVWSTGRSTTLARLLRACPGLESARVQTLAH